MQTTSLEYSIVLYGSLFVFNFANLIITRRILREDLSGLITEKGPLDPALEREDGATYPNSSYSRLAGLIGAIVLAIFLWAFGNVVIYLSLTDPKSVTSVLSSISSYFLAGSALFAPYAFNQLRTTFNPAVPLTERKK